MADVVIAEDAEAGTLAGFDAVIDARTPSEFALDHVPGAVNLPVLSDAERAEVGTIYVQDSRFKARRIGAAYVARNVARHLETVMAEWPGGFRPLVYCWRGGMRSNAMAVILSQVGWRTTVLKGGYRTYRRRVVARLYEGEPLPRVVLLAGETGTGKTEVLRRVGDFGVQTLDLEGLAEHRGSLLGSLPGRPQPSQKLFESRLLAAMERLDLSRPVVIEAESSKVGQLTVPPVVWSAMTTAPLIELTAGVEARARYLTHAYRDIVEDLPRLEHALSRLPDRPGRKRLDAWAGLAREGRFLELAEELIEAHYDPAYRRSSRSHDRPLIASLPIASLDAGGFETAARQIADLVASV